MRRYFLAPQDAVDTKRGEEDPDSRSHQSVSNWIAYIIPFEVKQTFTPSSIALYQKPKAVSGDAVDKTFDVSVLRDDQVIKTTPNGILLSDSVISWNLTSSKGSPVGSLTMTLPFSAKHDLENVRPGDWIMFWAFNSKSDYDRILKAIQEHKDGARANDFYSGLKFIGKIHGVREARSISASNAISTFFSLSCHSFSETMNVFPLTQALMDQVAASGYSAIISDFFKLVNYSVEKSAEPKGISIQELQTKILNTVFGPGPGYSQLNKKDASGTNAQVSGMNPEKPCLVPAEVGRLLGIPKKQQNNRLYFSDIISREIGIEVPPIIEPGNTKEAMLPFFDPIPFKVIPNEQVILNGSAWQIITEHSGDPVNEVFTAIKYTAPDNYDDGIYPTIKIRQIPFTSKEFADLLIAHNKVQKQVTQAENIKTTVFENLARWVVDSRLVYSEEFGYSDSTRSNYIFVYGYHPHANGREEIGFQANVIDRNPPVIDVADITRNGIRQRIKPMNMYLDTDQRPFSKLIADAYMGLHLKKDGRLVMAGVQEPVQPGENLEYDGYLYHIEGITMSGTISTGSGMKTFETQLDLSRGTPVSGVRVEFGKINFRNQMPDWFKKDDNTHS